MNDGIMARHSVNPKRDFARIVNPVFIINPRMKMRYGKSRFNRHFTQATKKKNATGSVQE
jgi:hypothetical protein